LLHSNGEKLICSVSVAAVAATFLAQRAVSALQLEWWDRPELLSFAHRHWMALQSLVTLRRLLMMVEQLPLFSKRLSSLAVSDAEPYWQCCFEQGHLSSKPFPLHMHARLSSLEISLNSRL